MEGTPVISDVTLSLFSARSSSITSSLAHAAPPLLYTAREIGVYDVLCGRDKAAFNNVGNRRFRVTVSLSLERYLQATTRKEKSVVIKSVVTMLHADGGKFLQQVSGSNNSNSNDSDEPLYMELNEKQAHEKAGHALRDMALLRGKPSSATTTTNKKNKAVDPPAMDDTIIMTTTTPATSVDSSIATTSQHKKIKRRHHHHDHHDSALPRTLDAWTVLTSWDESSELTLDDTTTVTDHNNNDESMFDHLVETIAINNTMIRSSDDNHHNNLPVVPTSTSVGISNNNNNEEGINHYHHYHHYSMMMDVDDGVDDDDAILRSSSTIAESLPPQRRATDPNRASSASFTLDDAMVSWLVGESDFVLQV